MQPFPLLSVAVRGWIGMLRSLNLGNDLAACMTPRTVRAHCWTVSSGEVTVFTEGFCVDGWGCLYGGLPCRRLWPPTRRTLSFKFNIWVNGLGWSGVEKVFGSLLGPTVGLLVSWVVAYLECSWLGGYVSRSWWGSKSNHYKYRTILDSCWACAKLLGCKYFKFIFCSLLFFLECCKLEDIYLLFDH